MPADFHLAFINSHTRTQAQRSRLSSQDRLQSRPCKLIGASSSLAFAQREMGYVSAAGRCLLSLQFADSSAPSKEGGVRLIGSAEWELFCPQSGHKATDKSPFNWLHVTLSFFQKNLILSFNI